LTHRAHHDEHHDDQPPGEDHQHAVMSKSEATPRVADTAGDANRRMIRRRPLTDEHHVNGPRRPIMANGITAGPSSALKLTISYYIDA
jgi:hypothetical protein